MRNERFEALAEAFGGDVSRWPTSEREAAADLMVAQPEWAGRILAQAAALDAQLTRNVASRGDMALIERIVAGAPLPRRAGWVAWVLPAGMGAGLAAASVAGFLIGHQIPIRQKPAIEAVSAVASMSDDDFGFDSDEEVS